MQVEISEMGDAFKIKLSNNPEAELLMERFDDCSTEAKKEFIEMLDDDYLIDELKSRGYFITMLNDIENNE